MAEDTGDKDKQAGAGGSGAGGDDWRAQLPEDLRDAPAFKDVKDVGSLAKQFVDLQKYQGQSIRIPGQDASQEDLDVFHDKLMKHVPGLMPTPDVDNPESLGPVYTRLGRPEKAENYKTPEMDTKDIPLDNQIIDEFKAVAHRVGLNQNQFATIVEEITKSSVEKAQLAQNVHSQGITELSKEWGAAYKERVDAAISVAQATNAPPALVDSLKAGAAGPETLKWLYGLSTQLGSETLNMVNQKGRATLTPDEAKNRISEIRNNKEHPYWKPADPAHDAARRKMRELHKLAYPGEAPGIAA